MLDIQTRCTIIDSYAKKLLNSGFKLPQVRRIILSAVKGYEKKRRNANFQAGNHSTRVPNRVAQLEGGKSLLENRIGSGKLEKTQRRRKTSVNCLRKGMNGQARAEHRVWQNRNRGEKCQTLRMS